MDGWKFVADKLFCHGLDPEPVRWRLYGILLSQNSEESIRGLTYLFNHVSRVLLDIPYIISPNWDTALHQLVSMNEYVRNDILNSRILRMLLTKFFLPTIVNSLNKSGITAIAAAAEAGNHNAMGILLDAGADLKEGDLSVFGAIMGRILQPNQFKGDISTLSSQGRKRRKHKTNTREALALLLHHCNKSVESRKMIAEVVTAERNTWSDVSIIKKIFQALFVAAHGDDFELRITGDKAQSFMVCDLKSGMQRLVYEME